MPEISMEESDVFETNGENGVFIGNNKMGYYN